MAEKIELKLYTPTQPQLDALKIINEEAPFLTIVAFGRQVGKMIADDSEVYTSEGSVRIDSLSVGDRIYGDDGLETTVLEIFPADDVDVWNVEFEDGTVVEACKDHLWGVHHKKKGYMVRTTEELSKDYSIGDKGESRYKVALTEPVQYQERELPIAPYDLGVLIGDGGTTTGSTSLTIHEDDAEELIGYMESEVSPRKHPQSYGVRGISQKILDLGLRCTSHNKFIPEQYKYASVQQRTELLQGLMDTDGTASHSVEYYSVSERLANDVADLARGLGLFAQVFEKHAKYNGEPHLSYRVRIRPNESIQLFKLKRKLSKVKVNSKYNTHLYKRIKKIELTKKKTSMRCLTVSNESKLFLTNSYTVTHNTFMAERDVFLRALNSGGRCPMGKKMEILWISPTADQATKSMSSIIEMFTGRDELFDMVVKKVNSRYPEIVMKNGASIKFRSSEQGDSLRGGTKQFIYLDEAAFMDWGFIQSVLIPMTTRVNGRFIMTSTFNGRNWYYDKYEEGQQEENKHRVMSIKRTFLDLQDPQVTRICMMAKETMSVSRFNQEYMCIPVSADAVFSNISSVQVDDPVIDPKEEHFMGIDVGLVNDDTVLSLQAQDGSFKDIERFNYRAENLSHKQYLERVWSFVKKHKDYTVAGHFEINGKELLFDQLCDYFEFSRIFDPFSVSSSTKPRMIEAMILGFEKKEITYPRDVETEKQLYDFRGKQNANGMWQFGNDSKSGHDDIVMSMAHANFCRALWYDGGTVDVW